MIELSGASYDIAIFIETPDIETQRMQPRLSSGVVSCDLVQQIGFPADHHRGHRLAFRIEGPVDTKWRIRKIGRERRGQRQINLRPHAGLEYLIESLSALRFHYAGSILLLIPVTAARTHAVRSAEDFGMIHAYSQRGIRP